MSQKTILINNVNQTTGEATITIQVAEGTNHLSGSGSVGVTAQFSPFSPGVAPKFNANNFAALDTTTTRKYYFGKNGYYYYGVSDGSVTAVSGTGQASGQVPYWELAYNTRRGSTTWGSGYNGQTILNYVNGLKDTDFNSADQTAMKNAGSTINTKDINSKGTGSIAASSAYMWPLSSTQYRSNEALARKVCGISSEAWTRSCGDYTSSTYHAYIISIVNSTLFHSNYRVDADAAVSPAFNLDLAKVLLGKTNTKNSNSESMTYIGTKVSEDLKFLINTGTVKASSFTIDIEGNYSGAVTTVINGGNNYISEIIYDSTGKSLYYGNIGTVTAESGTAELVIPDGIASGTYTVAVFEEEKCAANKTDYACTPVYFTLTV